MSCVHCNRRRRIGHEWARINSRNLSLQTFQFRYDFIEYVRVHRSIPLASHQNELGRPFLKAIADAQGHPPLVAAHRHPPWAAFDLPHRRDAPQGFSSPR